MNDRQLRLSGVAGLAMLAAAWAAGVAMGTVVVPMDVATMAEYAGQVIVGEVAETRSYWAENPRRIETELRLTGVTYLKGRLPDADDTFTLLVPGGTVGDMTMRLSGAPEPAVGQTWVLFLLPEYKTYPVVGLWQGAFRVVADEEGVLRVHDASGKPVVGINDEGMVQVAEPPRPSIDERLVSAEGVRVRPAEPKGPTRPALTLDEFRTVVEPVLNRSKDHELKVPAGRPVPAKLRPVPLRTTGSVSASGSLRGADAAQPLPADSKQRRARP
ncbi:MAG: hypothetical protein PVJ57_06300 [Phycisphaerae bacterium]|jgi:hypothetical protein